MAVQRTNSKIPRSGENDYTPEAAAGRREFLRERTGAAFDHVSEFSFGPALAQGNIENFIGVAQVPLGVAGPLLVNGEHAQGEFYVPLATAEGTLVASYNRGMRLLSEAGGVTTTVIADKMQRAPAFIFESAREARDFAHWLDEHFDEIKHADTEPLWRARLVSNLGGFMSGANNNGAHSANGITAIFIATGQDVANVAESSAAYNYGELQPNGDLYFSVTIPSLIVATYGGGTGLATQRECLELMGCYGKGKVLKLAEIIAATVLCGGALARLGHRGGGVGAGARSAGP